MADNLLLAAQAYRDVCKSRHCFTLDNGECVHVIFRPQSFVHLAGLRKLGDVYEFGYNNSTSNIYNQILRGQITILHAQCSEHYDTEARERIDNLARLSDVLCADRVIWDFDQQKVPFRTRLKSKVVFFHEEGFNFYLLLGAAQDGSTYYPETFFLRFDDAYIRGQTMANVVSYQKL